MIPLRDDNPRVSFPFITILMIAANVLVFLYQASLEPTAGQTLVFTYGMIPARFDAAVLQHVLPLGTGLLPLVTSMFLHGGWLHLIGNMWFLWIFGDNVEDAFGHFGYLFFYMVCGTAGGLAHVLANWDATTPAIGASGAIAGVMGAYIVLYPRAKVLTLVPLLVIFFTIRLPAIVVIGLWFAMQFLNGVGSLGVQGKSGVAFWAHIGGFAVGALAAALFARRPSPPVVSYQV
jgi:membrane associated rhomboid family serine protease